MRRSYKQFLLFSVVGTTSFIVDVGLLYILVTFFKVNPVLGAGISYIVSLIYNYVLSMKYVFSHREDLTIKKEFTIFMVLSFIGFGINELCMWLGEMFCVVNHLVYTEGNRYLIVKITTDCIVGFWNFFSRKYWLDASSSHRIRKTTKQGKD